MSTLAVTPLVPPSLLAVLAAAALAALALAVLRRAHGAWLRALPMAALLLALANPYLVSEQRQVLPDVAVVVVDDTLSQAIGDRRAQTAAALAELSRRLALQPNLEVRVERVRTETSGDDGTRLFAAIDHALADVPRRRLAGVVMITDGIVHGVLADLGRDLGAPVQVLLTGRPGESDRRLAVLDSPGYVLVGHDAAIRFRVEEKGGTGTAKVEVRVDGSPTLTAEVPLNRDASVAVPVRHAGQTVVELAAAPGPHELSEANNRAVVGISGVRDRLKVLLISGEPTAGERTWRNLLKADPAVDLVHFTILRPPEKDDSTPIRELSLITFPVRELFEDKLKQFDLVIFDRYRRGSVLPGAYYRTLADYVRGGGALLVGVGPEFADPASLYDPLATVLPAEPTGAVLEQPFRPTLTAVGRHHPVTAGLPGSDGPEPAWGSWLRQVVVRQKSGDAVLAGVDGKPLMVLDRVGDGRVAEVLSDSVWLWARGWEGGGPYNELLRRLAHWLMKEPELEEEALAAEVKAGRLEVTRHSLDGAAPTVTVTRPDGSAAQLPLTDRGDGRATGEMAADQPGLWRVEDSGRTAVAAAGNPAPLELAELAATPDHLAPVAAATGGSVRWLVDGGVPELRRVASGRVAAGRDWIGLAAREDSVVTGLRRLPLLPGIAVLALALGGLLLAWRREGR
jgi:hypothetical protein